MLLIGMRVKTISDVGGMLDLSYVDRVGTIIDINDDRKYPFIVKVESNKSYGSCRKSYAKDELIILTPIEDNQYLFNFMR